MGQVVSSFRPSVLSLFKSFVTWVLTGKNKQKLAGWLIAAGFVGGFRKQLEFLAYIIWVFWIYMVYLLLLVCPTSEDAQMRWSNHACKVLGLRFQEAEGSVALFDRERTMYLLNHRSFADFFVHDVITQYKANFLARMAVALTFPLTWAVTTGQNSVWFFNRGGNDLAKFFHWCDEQFSKPNTRRNSILVYPEGHRNLLQQPLRLKKGMLQYAYRRRMPVQIVMTAGLEHALNERRLRIDRSGVLIRYLIDKPFFPADFPSEDDFCSFLETRFISKFHQLNGTVPSSVAANSGKVDSKL